MKHAASASDEVPEASDGPKLRPMTVTDEKPLCTTFRSAYEATAPSKVMKLELVPTIAPTVIRTAASP